MKNETFSKFVLFLNQKTNCTFGTRIHFHIPILKWKLNESVGRKGHWIFDLKWNRILSFFIFSFSLSNWKTNFKSQFGFSIRIEKLIPVYFLRNLFCAQALLWSVTSPKLPLKTNLFIYFQYFKKWEIKLKFWFLFKSHFEIQMQFLNFIFFFTCKLAFIIYIKVMTKHNIYLGYFFNQ